MVVVPSLDRYRRSLQDLINMVAEGASVDRLHPAAREPGHHQPRRPTCCPRLRRARGVHSPTRTSLPSRHLRCGSVPPAPSCRSRWRALLRGR
ncbi:hypothetical protein ABZ446_41690 [Streptomyces sp. NPDC005813]|uniref:hypothetical protein n=1 Tax=Streptomyces sp. NPDC005813 TaxID=3155592 RepID=UPI0033F59A9E